MLKPLLLAKTLNGALQKVPSRNSAFGQGKVAMPGYNDLPKPKSGWKKHHAALQKKYNTVLGLGVFTFIAGIGCFLTFLDLHFYPPKNPNC